MNRSSAFFAFASIGVLYSSVTVAITLSPWFNWFDYALSDLGDPLKSTAAPIFNIGLLLTGFLLTLYSALGLKRHARKSAYFLAFSGFSIQLVGALNESFGSLHFYVSAMLFISLLASSLAYFLEEKSLLALIIILAIFPWVMHFQGILFIGAALPEIISSFAVLPWIVLSAIRVYRGD